MYIYISYTQNIFLKKKKNKQKTKLWLRILSGFCKWLSVNLRLWVLAKTHQSIRDIRVNRISTSLSLTCLTWTEALSEFTQACWRRDLDTYTCQHTYLSQQACTAIDTNFAGKNFQSNLVLKTTRMLKHTEWPRQHDMGDTVFYHTCQPTTWTLPPAKTYLIFSCSL